MVHISKLVASKWVGGMHPLTSKMENRTTKLNKLFYQNWGWVKFYSDRVIGLEVKKKHNLRSESKKY